MGLLLKLFGKTPSGLSVAGTSLALASASFAGYMVANSPREPYFGGLEHLALFAQPAGGKQPPASRSPAPLDMMPVGAIAAAPARSQSAVAPGPIVRDHVLLGLSGTRALIGTPLGPLLFGTGDEIPGIGRVIAIERIPRGWSVLTEGGRIVENPAAAL
jgi:hypothetical protein